MSKKLTPLDALERLYDFHNLPSRNIVAYFLEQENLPTYRNIIETALKDYEKKTKLAKEYADVDNVAKRLKALEIIKKEVIEFGYTHLDRLLEEKTYTYQDYINWCIYEEVREHYTKEEFDLLKEVLK